MFLCFVYQPTWCNATWNSWQSDSKETIPWMYLDTGCHMWMNQYFKVQIQVPSGNQTSLAGKSMEIPYKWIRMEVFSWKVIQLNGEFPPSLFWFTEVTVDEHPSLACLQLFWIVEVHLVGNLFNSTPGKICQIALSEIIGCISSMKISIFA